MRWLQDADDACGNLKAADLKPLFTWMTQQPEPWLRAAGWDLLSFYPGPDAITAATNALDTYFRAKHTVDEYILLSAQTSMETQNAIDVLDRAGKLRNYFDAILNEYEKNGTGLGLIYMRHYVHAFGIRCIPLSQALAYYKRFDKISTRIAVPEAFAKEDEAWKKYSR